MAISQPTIIPEPWASQGSRTTIPDATGESGRASWSLGFPPETALPLGSGGIPPHWLDFQGVLYALSNHAFFKQSGGRYTWSSSLDYPAGACIIGSDGKVYQALQNSGPGYSAGAKNPTTAGNSAYWGVLATPDGSSIVVNGSGKLAVSATNLASQLADGTTITASGGKLTAVNQGGDADALADGQTIVASNGKLKVNYGAGLDYDPQSGKLIVVFNDLTVEQIAALCDPDGGIAAGANGLYVDFDSMPLDRFSKMMSDMIDAQTISSAGGGNQFYVDGTSGSDSYPEERGAPDKPFQSIQACVNYITKVYKFTSVNTYINCQNINMPSATSTLTLPSFDRTTASITIRGATFTASTARNSPTTETGKTIKISYTPGGAPRYGVNVIGTGVWYLSNFDVEISDAELSSSGGHLAALHVQDYASCTISDCRFTNTRGDASKVGFTTGEHVVFISDYGNLDVGAFNEIVSNDEETSSPARVIRGISIADSGSMHINDTRSNHAYTLLEFTLTGAQGSDTTIPAETRVSDGASTPTYFKTNFPLTIPAGQTKGSVSASCETAGTDGNGFAAGAINTLVTSIANVASVTNTSASNWAASDDRRIKMTGSFLSLMNVTNKLTRNAAYQGQVDISGVENATYKFYIFAGGNVRVSDYGLLDATHHGDTYLGIDVPANPTPGTSNYLPNATPPVYGNKDGTARTSYLQTSTYSWYD